MNTNKVLVVDDDNQFQDFLSSMLAGEFLVRCASNKQEALSHLDSDSFDLFVIDYRLPDGNGHELIREIRSKSIEAPIVLVTGYANKDIAINSINLGINCLLEKPFEYDHLKASIDRVMKQFGKKSDFKLDHDQRCIYCGPDRITMTSIEYSILVILMKSRNKQVSREMLQKEIWGQSLISKHTLDTHIYNLKKKSPRLKKAVRVVHGTGFIFDSI